MNFLNIQQDKVSDIFDYTLHEVYLLMKDRFRAQLGRKVEIVIC